MYVSRPLQEADAFLDLREADALECEAAGLSTKDAIRLGLRGAFAYVIECDGVPVALWGYGGDTLLDEVCCAWLLTTPEIEKYSFRFARTSIRLIDEIHEIYPVIVCQVDIRHEASLKWLRWLGFLPAKEERGFIWMRRER